MFIIGVVTLPDSVPYLLTLPEIGRRWNLIATADEHVKPAIKDDRFYPRIIGIFEVLSQDDQIMAEITQCEPL